MLLVVCVLICKFKWKTGFYLRLSNSNIALLDLDENVIIEWNDFESNRLLSLHIFSDSVNNWKITVAPGKSYMYQYI